MMQNMLFKAHRDKAKSKREFMYLENRASYLDFCKAIRQNLKFSKKFNLAQFKIWSFVCDQTIIDFKITFRTQDLTVLLL